MIEDEDTRLLRCRPYDDEMKTNGGMKRKRIYRRIDNGRRMTKRRKSAE